MEESQRCLEKHRLEVGSSGLDKKGKVNYPVVDWATCHPVVLVGGVVAVAVDVESKLLQHHKAVWVVEQHPELVILSFVVVVAVALPCERRALVVQSENLSWPLVWESWWVRLLN